MNKIAFTKLSLSAACALALGFTACHGSPETAEPEAPTVRTATQPIVYRGLELGEGFRRPAEVGTGSSCLDTSNKEVLFASTYTPAGVPDPDVLNASAFYVHTVEDLDHALMTYTEGDFEQSVFGTAGAYTNGVADHYAQYFNDPDYRPTVDEHSKIFTLAVKVQTIRRGLHLSSGVNPQTEDLGGHCDPGNSPPGDLSEFLQRCGDSYLRNETLGGYLFLTVHMDVTDPSFPVKKVQRQMERLFQVGQQAHTKDINQRMQSLANYISTECAQNEACIQKFGFKVKIPSMWQHTTATQALQRNPHGLLEPRYFDAFIRGVKTPAVIEFMDGRPEDHPTYGFVLEQNIESYNPDMLINRCTGQNDGPEAFSCITNFTNDYRQFSAHSGAMDDKANEVRWKLKNPTRVQWSTFVAEPENPHDPVPQPEITTKYHERFVELYDACAAEMRAQSRTCQAIIYSEGPESYCEHCATPTVKLKDGSEVSCDIHSIDGEYNALPSAPIMPAVPFDPNGARLHHLGQNTYEDITNERICVLTRIQGNFNGGGESVSITRAPTNDNWHFRVTSRQENPSRKLSAEAYCVPTSFFFDTFINTPWYAAPLVTDTHENQDWKLSVGKTEKSELLGQGVFPSMVAGIGGPFGGGGEAVIVEQANPGDNSSIVVRNMQDEGQVTGWAITFGMSYPVRGEAQFSDLDRSPQPGLSQQITRIIASTRDAEAITNEKTGFTYRKLQLAKVDEALCFLAHVSGELDGRGEAIQLLQRDGYWHLEMQADCKSTKTLLATNWCELPKKIEAAVSCYKYDQRN